MVDGALGDLLPLALVIALSPIPIVACILMLFSARAHVNGPAFLLGWVLGVTAVTLGVRLLSSSTGGADETADGPTLADGVTLALGLLLIALAVRQWRARPKPGQEVPLPAWMRSVDTIGPGRALGLGLLLSAANPKNLTMAVAAGVAMSEAIAHGAAPVVLEVVFVVLASSSIGLLVLFDLVGGERAKRAMDGWRTWLVANNAAVMAVLFLVIGAKLIGEGLDAFLG